MRDILEKVVPSRAIVSNEHDALKFSKGAVMSGKFQMRMPGQAELKSYLEWSGLKHATTGW
jgi:hypothetical protein